MTELRVQDVFIIKESDAHVQSTDDTHGMSSELRSVDVVTAHTFEHVTGSRNMLEYAATKGGTLNNVETNYMLNKAYLFKLSVAQNASP